jgi:hypothetical protein
VRSHQAADALRQALDLRGQQQPEQALQALTNGLAAQQAVVARRRQALAAAQFARAPETAVRTEQACCAGEEAGLAALEHVIDTFPEGQQSAIAHCLDEFAAAARQPWADLAELMWQFDAHVQDRLAALSESQAIGYQLGRGLADTYWALNPGQEDGSASWSFLLGERRCGELAGLTGTLKNSAQALTKRLRQDVYTDLVALAVQTTPTPPDASALQRSIRRRSLTPATPN